MMLAPFATAQRIALASASTGIDRCGPTTFATSSSAGGASPAIPMPSFVCAAIRPATNVPCPCVSTVAGPGDEALGGRYPPLQLGMGAVDPGVDHGHANRRKGGGSGQKSNARFWAAYHWRCRKGSFGPNAAAGSPAPRRTAFRGCRATPPPEAPRPTARAAARGRRFREPPGRADARRPLRVGAGASPTARRAASTVGAAPRQSASRHGPCLGGHFGSPAGTVIVSAGPAWPSAVSR